MVVDHMCTRRSWRAKRRIWTWSYLKAGAVIIRKIEWLFREIGPMRWGKMMDMNMNFAHFSVTCLSRFAWAPSTVYISTSTSSSFQIWTRQPVWSSSCSIPTQTGNLFSHVRHRKWMIAFSSFLDDIIRHKWSAAPEGNVYAREAKCALERRVLKNNTCIREVNDRICKLFPENYRNSLYVRRLLFRPPGPLRQIFSRWIYICVSNRDGARHGKLFLSPTPCLKLD